jgi:hypothetical protein
LLAGLCLSLPLGLTFTSLAQAAWSSNGSGVASAQSYTMPNGGQPTASVLRTSVTLTWPAALFPDNLGVSGYLIARSDAANGAVATVGANCSGTVTTSTCTEQNVPAGTWIYTDTPVQDSWTGGQSIASSPVTVP